MSKLPLFQALIKLSFFASVCWLVQSCAGSEAKQAETTPTLTPAPAPVQNPAPVQESPATSGTLFLAASSVEASAGSQACLAVTARDFKQIVSMQYTMKWEPKILKFKEVRGFDLPALAVANFGAQATSKGLLTFSWYDPNVRGITKPDGGKLYEVCFDVTGKSGDKGRVEFTGVPVIVEITNAASQFLELKSETGAVSVR